MLNYTHLSKSTSLSFDNIMTKVKSNISKFSKNEQEQLKADLKHGTAKLTRKAQLDMYMKCYGEIHRAKLLKCYEKIPLKLWGEGQISIIDYGSGQGLAEIVLADFLKSQYINIDFVKDITLIEPSFINLRQSTKYLSDIFINSEITPILKTEEEVTIDDLNPKSNNVIHIFSNIIDLDNFNGENIASILSKDNEHNNIIICVNPYYQESSRGKKIDEFANKLRGYNCIYSFQKHLDEWRQNYSCQIRIYTSMYY